MTYGASNGLLTRRQALSVVSTQPSAPSASTRWLYTQSQRLRVVSRQLTPCRFWSARRSTPLALVGADRRTETEKFSMPLRGKSAGAPVIV